MILILVIVTQLCNLRWRRIYRAFCSFATFVATICKTIVEGRAFYWPITLISTIDRCLDWLVDMQFWSYILDVGNFWIGRKETADLYLPSFKSKANEVLIRSGFLQGLVCFVCIMFDLDEDVSRHFLFLFVRDIAPICSLNYLSCCRMLQLSIISSYFCLN